jgi:hypothetical protein
MAIIEVAVPNGSRASKPGLFHGAAPFKSQMMREKAGGYL